MAWRVAGAVQDVDRASGLLDQRLDRFSVGGQDGVDAVGPLSR